MSNEDVKSMEFEQAISELEKIVAGLENGTISLKDSVNMYERGSALKNRCESLLEHARLTVQQISGDPNTTAKENEQ